MELNSPASLAAQCTFANAIPNESPMHAHIHPTMPMCGATQQHRNIRESREAPTEHHWTRPLPPSPGSVLKVCQGARSLCCTTSVGVTTARAPPPQPRGAVTVDSSSSRASSSSNFSNFKVLFLMLIKEPGPQLPHRQRRHFRPRRRRWVQELELLRGRSQCHPRCPASCLRRGQRAPQLLQQRRRCCCRPRWRPVPRCCLAPRAPPA